MATATSQGWNYSYSSGVGTGAATPAPAPPEKEEEKDWTDENVLDALKHVLPEYLDSYARQVGRPKSVSVLLVDPNGVREGDRLLGWKDAFRMQPMVRLGHYLALGDRFVVEALGTDRLGSFDFRDTVACRFLVERRLSNETKSENRFPQTCGKCRAPAYVGFSSVECSTSGCPGK